MKHRIATWKTTKGKHTGEQKHAENKQIKGEHQDNPQNK